MTDARPLTEKTIRATKVSCIGDHTRATAAKVPPTMPAKKPQPLNRHQCHFNTLGMTKAGTRAEVSHLVTP